MLMSVKKKPKCNIMANKKNILLAIVFVIVVTSSYFIIFNSHLVPPLKNVSYTLSDLEIAETNNEGFGSCHILDGEITIDVIGVLAVGQPAAFTTKDFTVVFYSMEDYKITNLSTIENVTLSIRFEKNISETRNKFFGHKIEIPLNRGIYNTFEQIFPVSKEFIFSNQGNYDIIFSIKGNSSDRHNGSHFSTHHLIKSNEFYVDPTYVYYNLETNAYLLWLTLIIVFATIINIFYRKGKIS